MDSRKGQVFSPRRHVHGGEQCQPEKAVKSTARACSLVIGCQFKTSEWRRAIDISGKVREE